MANTNKMTKREILNVLCTAFQDPCYDEQTNQSYIKTKFSQDEYEAICLYIHNELILLAKKAERSSNKPSANQQANVGIKETMLNVLSQAVKPVTISEIMAYPELVGNSNQKLSALMKQLVDSGKVVRTTDKKKAFFSVVAPVKVEDNPTA